MIRLAVLTVLLLYPLAAAAAGRDQPVDFSADELVYDREMNLVIARGNVFFKQGDTTLKADHVNYDTIDSVVIASGNVEINTPDGGLVQGNYAKLSGDMKDGIIRQIQYTLSDQSVMTAADARHINGTFTEFNEVSYSSCDFCLDGSRFWEIKTKKMTHDKEAQDMAAQNATLFVSGVPLVYIPYFSYPDPSVKRRTGFLLPSFKSNKALGFGTTIPYYWVIGPYTDLLFNPLVATKGVLLAGNFRHNFSEGMFQISGSHIYQDDESRYNVRSAFRWDISDVWRTGFNVDHVSDDTYLRRYDIEGSDDYAPWLKSDVYVEALSSQTYFNIKAVHYQNMRYDVQDDTIADVVPQMTYSYNTAPSAIGGYWNFNASSAVLQRDVGDDSARLTVGTGWYLPGITSWGASYSFNATVRADGYDIKDYYIEDEKRLYSGRAADIHPQASLKVSYPFVSVGEKYNQILEPIVMGVIAPNSQNSEKIPNEDSRDLDFDDTFLFSENRFSGYDRFEPGARVNYGLKWSIYGQNSGYVSALVGQSYRFNKSDIFPPGSGLENQASDVVGRLTIRPNEFFSLEYAFRLDHNTFELNRSEVSLTAGNPLLRFGVDYMNLKGSVPGYTGYNAREELTFWLNSQITRYWSVGYNQRIDLSKGGGVLEVGGYVRYEDECFALETGIKKDYTYDRDYKGGVSFRLGIEFKPFGGFEV